MRSLSSREFCNREICPVLTHRANGFVHFENAIGSDRLFASYCLCSFLRKGIKDRDNSIPSTNSGRMETFPRVARHARLRCLVPRIHGIHRVTKLPLHEQEIRCARWAPRNSGAFHYSLSFHSHPSSSRSTAFPTIRISAPASLFITSLFVSSNGYNCEGGVTKGWLHVLLVQIGTRIRTLRVIGKGRVKIFIPIDRGYLFFEPRHCRLDQALGNTKICTNLDNRDSVILRLFLSPFDSPWN